MPDRFWSSEEYDERAHNLYNEGDFDGALEALKEGLALYPNDVDLCVGLGYARLAREEFAWARLAFERALVLDRGHEDAMVGMGEVLLRLGRRDEGLRLFGEVQELGYQDDVELMLTVGRSLYREGLFGRAKDVFTRLAAARPECAEAVASVGYTLHRLGDEVDACRQLRRALKQDPDLHEARIYLGHLLYDRGDWEGAMREFERVPPMEHWDSLAVWRLLELKRTVQGVVEDHPTLGRWNERLAELEAYENDPVEELLAEVEARVSGVHPWGAPDESQLELFEEGEESEVIQIRLPGGQVLRGGWCGVVRQLREEAGFSHDPMFVFMRRMAERWHEQFGVEVPSTDPEGFLRGAEAVGLFRFLDEPVDLEGPPESSG